MVDIVSPQRRSQIMSKIRGRDTRPERIVRSYLHRAGLRYRLYRRDLPGSPDLVFPKYRFVLFVHGCFWHQHPGCKRASMPSTRRSYWKAKLERNVERDRESIRQLHDEGWRVQILWECEIEEKLTRDLVEQIRKGEGGAGSAPARSGSDRP